MKQNEDSKQASIKGILLTGNKPILSKSRRVSWGDSTVKEFASNNNDFAYNTLNNIEEESSSSKDFSGSDSNSTIQKNVSVIDRMNQQSSNSLNRLTINNIEELTPLNISDKENIPEINQLKNQRLTIENLKDVIDKNEISDIYTNTHNNKVQFRLNQPEQSKPKAKRYTLSLQEAYGNLLKSVNDNDTDDDINNLSFSFDHNNNNSDIGEMKEIIKESEKKEEKRLITPKESIGIRFSINSTNSDKKNHININQEAKSGSLSADKRITILTPKDFLQNSHSLKKNPTITHNLLVSPVTKLNISFLPNASVPLSSSYLESIDQINKRIQDQITYLTEKGNQKQKVILDLEKDMESIKSKLNEFIEEESKIDQQKTQIHQSITKLSNDYNTLSLSNIQNSCFKDVFGIKVLNVHVSNHTFELLILNRIKILFVLVNINDLFEDNTVDSLKTSRTVTLSSVNFTFINKSPNIPEDIIDNIKTGHILKTVYNDLIKEAIILTPHLLADFIIRIKYLIKLSASFLYLLNTLNSIFTISNNTNIKYEKDKGTLKIMFDILNKQGFKLNFLFEINIKDSFLGVFFRDLEWVNVYMQQSAFLKLQTKFLLLKSQIEKYLGLKDPTQIMYHNFFYTLNDNVQNL